MSNNNVYGSAQRWGRFFRRWITRILRRKQADTSPIILERYYGKAANLFRLERTTFGAVSSWRIIPRYGSEDILVQLDSFRQLRADLAREPKFKLGRKKFGVKAWKHPLTSEARKVFLWQPNKDKTHLLWVEIVSRKPVANQLRLRYVGIWSFDLEGFSPAWAGYERYAETILRTAVRKLISYEESEFQKKVMDKDSWFNLIDVSAKAYLGQSHQI